MKSLRAGKMWLGEEKQINKKTKKIIYNGKKKAEKPIFHKQQSYQPHRD